MTVSENATTRASAPRRVGRPPLLVWIAWAAFLAIFIDGVMSGDLTPARLVSGFDRLVDFLSQAFPPDLSRIRPIISATWVTLEMAVVGTTFGAILSLPLALAAARNTSPHPIVYTVSRAMIGVMRAIPDLIWALIFVVAIGLGPAPGMLAITVDVMGFCGRFFAERIEEIDPGPVEALQATGASRSGVIAGAIVPMSLPSFVATTLFSLESAVRSAVILGLVGAGGIGIELTTSMTLLRYDEALTVILAILIVVVGVERISSLIRRRLI